MKNITLKGLNYLFKKQFFPESTVKAIATNQSVYDTGEAIFKNAGVKNLTVNEENRSVIFTVSDGQTQKVYLSFLENGLAQKYSCDCRDFQKQSGACRHVIASMLYLNTINQESFDVINSLETEDLGAPSGQLQSVQKNRQILTNLFASAKKDIDSKSISYNKTTLQFEYILNMYSYNNIFEYELYLKVGVDHLYVVKDILSVAKHLLNGDEYVFGKQLTYNPKNYGILPEDREFLKYIYDVAQIQEETINMVTGGRITDKNGVMTIPPKYIQNLLRHLIEVDGGFVRQAPTPRLLSSINQLEIPEIVMDDNKLPLAFQLDKNEDYFVLNLSKNDLQKKIVLHPEANMVKVENVFHLFSTTDYNRVELLLSTMQQLNNQALRLTTEDLTAFYSLILPNLKEFFDYTAEEDIEEQVEQLPLEAGLYIDYQDNQLIARPEFKYGETKINPLRDRKDVEQEVEDDKAVLIRDVYKENNILNVLSHFFRQAKMENSLYIIEDLEDMSVLIYDNLVDISPHFNVYLSRSAEDLIYHEDVSPHLAMELNKSSNLLDIKFDLVNVANEELPTLVKQLQKTDERFYKLKSGKIVDLKDDYFQDFLEQVQKIDLKPDEITEDTSISLFRGLALVEEADIDLGENLREFIKELKEPENLEFEVPNGLQADLRPYQVTGFKWLRMLDYYGLGGVLADDMGLGKTIQTITFILSKFEQDPSGKVLIVSPSSVLYNWEKEFKEFAPSIKTRVISGTVDEREVLINETLADDEINVLITSYPLIQRDIYDYKNYKFESIILDESQTVKNDAAKTTKAVKQLNSNNIFALSGTPIENNLNELWSLFAIVAPGLFPSKKGFNEMTEKQIAQKIDFFVLRRMKEDVLDDLPPKTETEEFIELSTEQKQLYQTQLSLIRSDVETLIEDDSFEENRMKVLAGMTRLRQICCDPRLIDKDYTGNSAKLDRLREYLREAFANNKRVVLFSQFTSMLAIIRDILDEQGVDYHYLDGSTPKMDRLELTTRFNEGEKDLFLISLRAGGTGLNLTGGDTVILYDSWWNPAVEDQAADRVHRFGQDKPVQVIRLIMKGTIEEGINELQEQKRELIDSVIRREDEKAGRSLTKEDILRLLTADTFAPTAR